MELTIPTIIAIVVNIIIVGIGYGTLKTKIDEMSKFRDGCNQKFRDIELNHKNSMDVLQNQMNTINNTLNQLVGQMQMFLKLYGQTKER